jgi:hypothetical protein
MQCKTVCPLYSQKRIWRDLLRAAVNKRQGISLSAGGSCGPHLGWVCLTASVRPLSAQRLKATSASRAPKANASCGCYRSNSVLTKCYRSSPLSAGASVGRASAPFSVFSTRRVSCSGCRFSPMRRATPSPPRLVRGNSHNAAGPTTLLASACRRLESRQHTLYRRRCP